MNWPPIQQVFNRDFNMNKNFFYLILIINFICTIQQNALASSIDYDVFTYYKSPNWYIGAHEEYEQKQILTKLCADKYKGTISNSRRVKIRFQEHLFLANCNSQNDQKFAKGVEHYIYVGVSYSKVGWRLDQKESDIFYNQLISECQSKYGGEISNVQTYKESGSWEIWLWGRWILAGKCTTNS